MTKGDNLVDTAYYKMIIRGYIVNKLSNKFLNLEKIEKSCNKKADKNRQKRN